VAALIVFIVVLPFLASFIFAVTFDRVDRWVTVMIYLVRFLWTAPHMCIIIVLALMLGGFRGASRAGKTPE